MKNNHLKIKSLFFSVLIFAFIFFNFADKTSAAGASLYLSPSNGSYNIGSSFKVLVKLNSGGQAVNAAEGTLVFDPDMLSVVSISKSGSVFNLWTTEPIFSNTNGSISFGGGSTSNFTGSSGTVIAINFQAKANGKADVKFSSGSILASDGKGTNVLANMVSGSYAIQPQAVGPAEEAEYIPPKNTPDAPQIISSTHPESEKWYADNNPKFSWDLPAGVTSVKFSLDRTSRSVPGKTYKEAISEEQLEGAADGVWYFNLQLCNKSGCGKVSHFKIQIDSTKPSAFQVISAEGDRTTNTTPAINFEVKDSTSGIDYYQVKTDNENWIDTKESSYRLSSQAWGKHTILVRAIDKAGNSNLSATEIEIIPLPAPKIIDSPKEMTSGGYLTVSGTSLAGSILKIYIQYGDKVEEDQALSDLMGRWSYTYGKPTKTGIYKIWAETIDSNGGKSKPSDKATISANPPAFLRIGKIVIDYLTVSLVLLILIFAIILGIIWGYDKVMRKLEKVMKKTTKAEKSLFRAFKHLEKEVEKEVARIDGNPKLSKREKKVSESLKAALRSAEKYIDKGIRGIEKELDK